MVRKYTEFDPFLCGNSFIQSAVLTWMVSVIQHHHLIRLLRAIIIPKLKWNLFNGDVFFSALVSVVEWIHPVISYNIQIICRFSSSSTSLSLCHTLTLFCPMFKHLCSIPSVFECIFYVYHFICYPRIVFIYRMTVYLKWCLYVLYIRRVYIRMSHCLSHINLKCTTFWIYMTEAATLDNIGKFFEWPNITTTAHT